MKNPVPFRYRWYRRYNACPKQPDDGRDIVLGDIPYIPDPNAPTWEVGFNNEDKYGKLKREHQGSSLSCVGQGWSKYVEMLNKIYSGIFKDLSAKDVYSQIYLDNGGAYIRDGAKICVDPGVCEEKYLSSYLLDGSYPTETFMRVRTILNETLYNNSRNKFKALRFVHLNLSNPIGPRVIKDEDWETIRQIIWQFGGFVSGYKGHCMYVAGYGLVNGKKTIYFINSYGEGSDREWNEETSDAFYDVTFLYFMENTPPKIDMYRVIRVKDKDDQYIVVDNDVYKIPDVETWKLYRDIKMIEDKGPDVISQKDFDKFTYMGILPSKKLMDVLEPIARDIYLSE